MVAGIPELLDYQSSIRGSFPFLTVDARTWTFDEVRDAVIAFANGCAQYGTAEGDIIACQLENRIEFIIAWFAAEYLGAVFLPIHPMLPKNVIRELLAPLPLRILVQEHAAVPHEMFPFSSSPPHVFERFDVLRIEGQGRTGSELHLQRPVDPSPDMPSKILFTSGTTGAPKAVVWSRRCEWTWVNAYGNELLPLSPGECVYTCLPLTHVTCQGTVGAALTRGAHAVIDRSFLPFQFWNRVQEVKARMCTCVGTILETLYRRPVLRGEGETPLERIVTAGTPASIWHDFEERFQCTIIETWGQTETASCWFMPRELPMQPGTIGEPVESRFAVRIVRDDGTEAAEGEAGELLLQPTEPQIMADRYIGDQETGQWNRGGWYSTGDLVKKDASGFHFITRTREAIRRHGEMIAPRIIEDAVLEHPNVAAAAAVGVPDHRFANDEAIKLCIIPKSQALWDDSAVTAFLRQRLDRRLLPTWISVYDTFPLTPSTRIRRVELAHDDQPRHTCRY